MAGLNRVMLIGNLGRDPEIRYSQQGTAVVNFSIATSEQWTDKNTGEKLEKTEWHRVVVFGRQAEVCEKYLSKGSKVYIEGRLQTRTYEKEGQNHYITEIIAQSFQFLSGKQDSQASDNNIQSAATQQNNPRDSQADSSLESSLPADQESINDDDIPF